MNPPHLAAVGRPSSGADLQVRVGISLPAPCPIRRWRSPHDPLSSCAWRTCRSAPLPPRTEIPCFVQQALKVELQTARGFCSALLCLSGESGNHPPLRLVGADRVAVDHALQYILQHLKRTVAVAGT
jgi:hypothetical protein